MKRHVRFPWPTPYVIAAVDGNHDGRVAMARRLIGLAADAGANAVKFIVSGNAERGSRDLPESAWRELRREARHRVHFIAAPHDAAAFALARRLKPDAYQVDAEALGDLRLVRAIARERRPVFVVAGACTTDTLRDAVRALARVPVIVLHTVSAAPLAPARARLRYVPWLAERLGVPAGYLGLESGAGWAVPAVVLGAVAIEKPFTLDHSLPGAAHAASLDPAECRALVTSLQDLTLALAPVGNRRVFVEEMGVLERTGRSLVARRTMRRGHVLRPADVVSRPSGDGLSPRLTEWLNGRRLKYNDVEIGEALTFGMVDAG